MNPDTPDSRMASESPTVQEDHVERLLDLALEATFPASDALALPLGAYDITVPDAMRISDPETPVTSTPRKLVASVSGSLRNGDTNP